MLRFLLTFILITAASCGLTSVALEAETQKASLTYAQIELASQQGVDAVYKRLRMSAKRACEASSPLLRRDQMQCIRELEDQLVDQIADPAIIAVHRTSSSRANLATAN